MEPSARCLPGGPFNPCRTSWLTFNASNHRLSLASQTYSSRRPPCKAMQKFYLSKEVTPVSFQKGGFLAFQAAPLAVKWSLLQLGWPSYLFLGSGRRRAHANELPSRTWAFRKRRKGTLFLPASMNRKWLRCKMSTTTQIVKAQNFVGICCAQQRQITIIPQEVTSWRLSRTLLLLCDVIRPFWDFSGIPGAPAGEEPMARLSG